MANEFVREPDEKSGPAILNREPILLPEQRKRAAESVKDTVEEVTGGGLFN